MIDRAEALYHAWMGMLARTEMKFSEFMSTLFMWDVYPIRGYSGEVVGALIVNLSEVHISVDPAFDGKWYLRPVLRGVVADIIKEFGYVTTYTTPDSGCNEFIQKVGFKVVGIVDEGFLKIKYEMRGFAVSKRILTRGQSKARIIGEGYDGDPFGGPAYGELNDIGTALVMGGASILGGVMQSNAAEDAAQVQANAAERSAQLNAENQKLSNAQTMEMYQQTRQDTAPWREAGATALGQLTEGTKPGVDFNKGFSFTMDNFHADPGYQFSLDQATKALQRTASANGTLSSGGFNKAIADYTLGSASQEYGDVYNRAYNQFTNDTSNRFNRMATIAGLGGGANTLTSSAGSNAAGTMANTNANSAMARSQAAYGAGNATSAGIIGGANNMVGGIGSAINQYNSQSALNNVTHPTDWNSIAATDNTNFNDWFSTYGE